MGRGPAPSGAGDNVGPDRERDRGLDQPHLAIRSDEPRSWDAERVEGLRGYLSRNRAAVYEAVIRGSSHMSFTDVPFAVPAAAPGTLAPERVHSLTAALVRAFLARHLGGGPAPRLEEVATADEVVLTVLAGAAAGPDPRESGGRDRRDG